MHKSRKSTIEDLTNYPLEALVAELQEAKLLEDCIVKQGQIEHKASKASLKSLQAQTFTIESLSNLETNLELDTSAAFIPSMKASGTRTSEPLHKRKRTANGHK